MENLVARRVFHPKLFRPLFFSMPKLVFDIETTASPLEEFDDVQQEFLFREANRLPDEEARATRRGELQQLFSLCPLTGKIVCIAMLNAETLRGQVHFTAEDFESSPEEAGPAAFIAHPGEAEMLAAFWDVAKHYDSIVTFNGRGFDVPFIYLRSALLEVPITRKEWLGYRFQIEPHCDLADQLTFYGGSRDGATRRLNLDFYCKAFGIESPKSHGVSGVDVPRLIQEHRHREVAEYCLRDAQATAALYRIWRERLSGIR